MRIRVHLDSARLFRWHLVLFRHLEEQGHNPAISFVNTREPLPTSLTALFDYDRARNRAGDDRFSTRLNRRDFAELARPGPQDEELTLDLSTASRIEKQTGRVLRPLYDGSLKDYALFHALLQRRAPRLSLSDSIATNTLWDIGLPAIETPWRIATAYDQVTSRLVQGILTTLVRIVSGEPPAAAPPARKELAARSSILPAASSYASQRAARKLSRLKDKMSGDAPKWHVAWRAIPAGSTPQPGTLSIADFKILPDDGKRYFADPFVLVRDGRRHVFVEEVPDATGRGRIAHFEIGLDGRASQPRTVLEAPYHLSYPFVFVHDGDVWMLPESAAGGGLDLYRAIRFPETWEKVARLIGTPLHDATLFERHGLYWIAASSQMLQSATWDALSLYSAERLLGPWQAHARNPVLVDASAARPAGALWTGDGGALVRPAQDCSRIYGGRLTLRRIERLVAARLTETTLGTLSFAPASEIGGPHTLSRGGGLEIIDVFARPSVLRAGGLGISAL